MSENETYTPGPWEFANIESVFRSDDEVTELVGADGVTVLEIGWGGCACESDPGAAYPILEASDEDWALIKAAPDLLDACEWALAALRESGYRGTLSALLESAIAKARPLPKPEEPA